MVRSQLFHILIFATFLYAVEGTQVRECSNSKLDIVNGSVTISDCDSAPCKLRKKTEVQVIIKFTPEKDIPKLLQKVHIVLLGNVPFPFLGVDGTSACGKLFEADGTTKANCPLIKGKNYEYHNSIKVLEIYPNVNGVVHWALFDPEQKKDVTCFEILSKIL